MFNPRGLYLDLLAVFEIIHEPGPISVACDRLALCQSATSHAPSRLREACKESRARARSATPRDARPGDDRGVTKGESDEAGGVMTDEAAAVSMRILKRAA